jgi:hypothetical protein
MFKLRSVIVIVFIVAEVLSTRGRGVVLIQWSY